VLFRCTNTRLSGTFTSARNKRVTSYLSLLLCARLVLTFRNYIRLDERCSVSWLAVVYSKFHRSAAFTSPYAHVQTCQPGKVFAHHHPQRCPTHIHIPKQLSLSKASCFTGRTKTSRRLASSEECTSVWIEPNPDSSARATDRTAIPASTFSRGPISLAGNSSRHDEPAFFLACLTGHLGRNDSLMRPPGAINILGSTDRCSHVNGRRITPRLNAQSRNP
jgi:hypothetical protein